MRQESRKSIAAPRYLHTDGPGANTVLILPWIEYRERGPPFLPIVTPGEIPSIVGNFAAETEPRKFHMYANNSMKKETV